MHQRGKLRSGCRLIRIHTPIAHAAEDVVRIQHLERMIAICAHRPCVRERYRLGGRCGIFAHTLQVLRQHNRHLVAGNRLIPRKHAVIRQKS